MIHDWRAWLVYYGVCPLLGGLIIWYKQGRYLTEEQPFAFLLFGPITLLLAVCVPPKWMTSRAQAFPVSQPEISE